MNKSQYWQGIIEQWKTSGLTQKQFCSDRQIKIATLHYWIKKSERPNPLPKES